MNHLSAETLVQMFSPEEIIHIVQDGIKQYAEEKYFVPERMHINRGESTNLIMPAFGEQYYCTKLISVDPNNNFHNLPIISGMLILNNSETGEALVTMDAPMVTALRTAAVGSIGLDWICDKNIGRLGIIGLGVQGFWQTIFAASTRNIREVYCYSRSQNKFKSYTKRILEQFPDISIHWCSTGEEVVQSSEVIITCTTSKRPVFKAEGLNISDKKFISVGSFAKDMQELPDEVYLQADAMIIDSKSAMAEVGDVIQTVENNWISQSNIYTLAELVGGKWSINKHENIVFKSVGMAAFDLALAIAIYERNLEKLKS